MSQATGSSAELPGLVARRRQGGSDPRDDPAVPAGDGGHDAQSANGYNGRAGGRTSARIGAANDADHANGSSTVNTLRSGLIDSSLLPDGKYSLSGIGVRAFGLGVSAGMGFTMTLLLAWFGSPTWRAPFFVTALSVFHFLEFWVTAEYNTPLATPEAFILTANGWAYNAAHVSALIETVLVHGGFVGNWTRAGIGRILWGLPSEKLDIFGGLQGKTALLGRLPSMQTWQTICLVIGFTFVIVGQATRTLAMATAGVNFNHLVQTYRRQEHALVTSGIYAWLRHPSYFGFFWWALGTQLILGNVVCSAAYTMVLWLFFSERIQKEEIYLISFFGKRYIDYREKTRVGIPCIA